jgi:hypothetical protein
VGLLGTGDTSARSSKKRKAPDDEEPSSGGGAPRATEPTPIDAAQETSAAVVSDGSAGGVEGQGELDSGDVRGSGGNQLLPTLVVPDDINLCALKHVLGFIYNGGYPSLSSAEEVRIL